jgi:large conductance mechanosensitive channel
MKKGKGFLKEFKDFALKGNVMNLAVGVIIGGAFGAIVTSLVDDIIMPLISLFWKADNLSKISVVLPNGTPLTYGNFIAAVINFLIMALVIFLMVKIISSVTAKLEKKEEEEEAATTKVCPFCKSEIAIDATRCPHCTSELK